MIPSLLQIPSAVSDSKLHSVLPNNGKGDFTFDRSTGATRINRDGLIEEVGYFSSELVQNGDFSELGSEAVTNGDFSTDSDWSKGTGWSIINGKARASGVSGSNNLTQSGILTAGKTYKITITVSEYVSGTVEVSAGASPRGEMTGNGTYTFYQVATPNTSFYIISQVFNGAVDNVSVKQVDPNDRWSTQGDVTFSLADFQGKSQVAKVNINDTSTGSRLRQAFNYVSGAKYKISVEVYLVNGSFRVDSSDSFAVGSAGSNDFVATTTTGSWINLEANFDAVATGSDYIWIRSTSQVAEFYVSNISVVEVQGDRPRLSYDITNGVVDSQPHLLLEPSATNLVTFSEDFSQSYWVKSGASVTSGFVSPDGTNNAYKLVEDSANSRHFINSTEFSTPDTVYSSSVFVKPNGRNKIALRENAQTGNYASFNLSNGTLIATNGVSASIESMFNGWYRINYQITSGASIILGFELLSDSYTSGDPYLNPYQGDGSSGIYIFGAQVESQSYATSYIKTAGTTITRAAETCNNSKPSVNSTEGVLYCEIAALTDLGSYRLISLSDGTSISNRITILYDISDNKIYGQCVVGGGTVAFIPFVPTSISDFHKIAFKYKANDFQLWVDGVKVGTDTSGSTPTGLSRLSFDRADGVDDWYGKVKGLAVYNEALSESQLMQLTGVTASSIYNNFVTRTASFTVEALNEVKKVIDNL